MNFFLRVVRLVVLVLVCLVWRVGVGMVAEVDLSGASLLG